MNMDTHYSEVYSEAQLDDIRSEFSRLTGECYLEHVGATLYSDVQMSDVVADLSSNTYGNPHAYNTSSKLTADAVDLVRYQVLQHFNTDLATYSVVFTSGATAALKLVAETFNYGAGDRPRGSFVYLEDSHTSVAGMREYASHSRVLGHDAAFRVLGAEAADSGADANSLFAYPAQCNFSGTKYPLSWIERVRNGALNQLDGVTGSRWYCLLDAASYVPTNALDLGVHRPDFVCLSFYKMFGYPTGVGALLVRNASSGVLRKRYFGGGTVQMCLPTEFVFRESLHQRFEDGTLPFLAILALRHGFHTLSRLKLPMESISEHTFALARYVHHRLLLLHHSNGSPVAVLYHDTDFEERAHQGGIVNFNLLRDNGAFIGYSEVLQMANLYKIHLRTGCFCNPGACRRHLGLTPQHARQHFNAGHVCGDQNDLVDGVPTGSVRASFGYMSMKQDADKLLEMVQDCFLTASHVTKIPNRWSDFQAQCRQKFPEPLGAGVHVTQWPGRLRNVYVYPVKSCGAWSAEGGWSLGPTGLRFDRQWMVVNSAGVCLTQKHEPRLCLITPTIQLERGLLRLDCAGFPSLHVPLEVNERAATSACHSKVCGDRVECLECGEEAAGWLRACLGRADVRLVRQRPLSSRTGQDARLSLVNQAQYLLLNTASVRHLADSMPDGHAGSTDALIARFRANFVVECERPYVEDESRQVVIGERTFHGAGPCTRCQMICIDQSSGRRGPEPLRTLALLGEGRTRFGLYLRAGPRPANHTLRVGEKVIFK